MEGIVYRIEANSELSDDSLSITRLPLGLERLHECLRPTTRNGSEVRYHVLLTHSRAVIFDNQKLLLWIRLNADLQLIGGTTAIESPLIPLLLKRITRVADKLPEKYLLLSVDRVRHNIE